VTHWLIALSIVVLAATGFYIGNPFLISAGPAGQRFVMGTVKVVHFYAAIVFTLAVLARVLWMFIGNRYERWDMFIPVASSRRAGIAGTLRFYLFLQRKLPGGVGHNPVAGIAYTAVFLLYFLEIATGLALYGTSAHVGSWLRGFALLAPWLGGLQTVRWLHHVGMWLLLGFVVHHIYSAVLTSSVEGDATLDSIFTGYKVVPSVERPGGGSRVCD
jgi:Ni/Fe-hydrogenase 1 B-type cytochrome subunit